MRTFIREKGNAAVKLDAVNLSKKSKNGYEK
jgi:hypothetical protein